MACVAANAATRVLPQPTSPCTKRNIGFGSRKSAFDFQQHALLRGGHGIGQRGEKAGFQNARRFQRPARIALYAPAQQLERQLVRQQFLECQTALRRMPISHQQIHGRIGGRPVNVQQRIAQRGQARIGEQRRRQPILGILGAGLVQRQFDQQAQPSLGHAFRHRIDRREMFLGRLGRVRIHAPVFRMHELQTLGTAPRLAETTHAGAARQALLLLRREIKKSQRQEA